MAKYFCSIGDPEISDLLKSGAVGVIPTDTVYGLVACANSKSAISRMYSLKDRPSHPGTIIGDSLHHFEKLGFPHSDLSVANRYWPAPVSIVIDSTNVPAYLKEDRDSIPLRIPDSERLLKLLSDTGPLMTTSANSPHAPTATTIAAAQDYFGDEVDFYVDGGDLSDREPSTIIGVSGSKITVYRKGAVDINSNTN